MFLSKINKITRIYLEFCDEYVRVDWKEEEMLIPLKLTHKDSIKKNVAYKNKMLNLGHRWRSDIVRD